MKNRTWTILFGSVLSVLIVTLMSFAFTYGRYSEEVSSENHNYGSDIEYIVADQVEVKDMNEFIGAIQNGYSNIIIAEDAQEEIIVTAGVTDVGIDLILNLNGHKIIRNNREPVLNVQNGIRLTILDTSKEQTGAFYNPVGSVLQISGGTLTVSGGIFESGPRKSEYVSGASGVREAEVFRKTDSGYVSQGVFEMPYLTGEKTGEYYESDFNSFVTADTYLYYSDEDPDREVIVAAESGSADFYYTYTENGVEVIIYGYNNVKGSATDETNYATVSMQSGNMYVRGGQYRSYFGKSAAYGIYADGGYMAVEAGSFSVIEDGTCLRCNYDAVSEKEYLRVAGGEFSSEWGDTIRVNGGKLAVTGGKFRKDASNAPAGEEGSAIIRIANGVLTGEGTRAAALNFYLTGSGLYGIYADGNDIEVSLSLSEFVFEGGSANTGIFASGGSVNLSESVFSIPSSDSYGVRAEAFAGNSSPSIHISGCVFQMTGAESTGVFMQEGEITLDGTAVNPYTLFYIDRVENCYGVLAGNRRDTSAYASVGKIVVNVNSAQFFMGQTVSEQPAGTFHGAGVYVNADNSVVNIKNGLFITAGNGTSGIYAEMGSVVQKGQNSKLVVVTGAVYNDYAAGGKKDGWITFPRPNSEYVAGVGKELLVSASHASESYGIYASDGTIELESAYVALFGASASGVMAVQDAAAAQEGNNILASALDVDIISGDVKELSVTALSTQHGNISLGTATINTDSLGITAQGGNVTVSQTLTLNATRGTAIYVNGGNLSFGEGSSVKITSKIDASCSWGGNSAPYSYDGVFVEGGSLIADGVFDVAHTGTENEEQYDGTNGSSLYREFVVRSYAVRVKSIDRAAANVSILRGEISNSVGGGVYVSVSGDTDRVTLGETGSDSLTIRATGGELYESGEEYIPIENAAGNWSYRQSKTGGHAVEVNGGNLTLNGGNYSSAQGEGILVKSGVVNVYGGTYVGKDNYSYNGSNIAGPAASYSFKMYGGTANIYGGTFGLENGAGSGAFIMGNLETGAMADANIYGGTFSVGGQAGFSLFDYADVLFAPYGGENGAGSDINVSGVACGIAVENRRASVKIEITGGNFKSTGASGSYDGIWYSNPNAQLTIRGGTFQGSVRSGLYFEVWPNSGNVLLYGGTFIRAGWNSPIGGNYSEQNILAGNYYLDKSSAGSWTVRSSQ